MRGNVNHLHTATVMACWHLADLFPEVFGDGVHPISKSHLNFAFQK